MSELMKNIDDLLVALVDDRKAVRINAPNFFSFKSLSCKENDLSHCIKDLLNPSGSHGQDSIFLEEFIKVIKNGNLNNSHWIDAKRFVSIKTEEKTSEKRRIDIFLEFEDGLIGIENKPWNESNDLKNQISDYIDELKLRIYNKIKNEGREDMNPSNYCLIYLSSRTPNKNSISNENVINYGKNGNYQHLTFKTLTEWLRYCDKEIPVRVSFFIKEMIRYIDLRIHKIKEECHMKLRNYLENSKDDTQRDAKLKELFLLESSIKSFQDECFNNFTRVLESLAEINQFEIITGNEGKGKNNPKKPRIKNYYFSLRDKNQKSNIHLTFEFMANDFGNIIWGLRKQEGNFKKDEHKFKEIHKIYSQKSPSSGLTYNGKSEWWAFSSSNTEKLLDIMCSDWGKFYEPWLKIIEKNNLAKNIMDEAIKIRNLFEGNQDLLELQRAG